MFMEQIFHDKMREAQAEIRSTMSVNTTEMAKLEEGQKDPSKSGGKRPGRRAIFSTNFVLWDAVRALLHDLSLAFAGGYVSRIGIILWNIVAIVVVFLVAGLAG